MVTVAQMSSKHLWTDVKLISFDLQTVEFTYSSDYSVSLTCSTDYSDPLEDKLSAKRSSYHLRFGRVLPDSDLSGAPPPDPNAMDVDGELSVPLFTNPHEDAEPFLCALLAHGSLSRDGLSTALHQLVAVLRATLPIVAELEEIRAAAARAGGPPIDTFAKSARWFRVLYGDLRHALDFRLMADARVAVLDASHTFCEDIVGKKPASTAKRDPWASLAALNPIPEFGRLVSETVKAAAERGARGRFASIGMGIVCEIGAVGVVGRILHEKVQARLASGTGTGA